MKTEQQASNPFSDMELSDCGWHMGRTRTLDQLAETETRFGDNELDSIVLEPRSFFDGAILGYSSFGSAVYSVPSICLALMKKTTDEEWELILDSHEGDYDNALAEVEQDAYDYYQYNIVGTFSCLPLIDEENSVANPIFVWH